MEGHQLRVIADAVSAAPVSFLWQGTLVGLLLWLARIGLRTRSANDRYAASCAAPSFATGSTGGPLLYRVQRLLNAGGSKYVPSRWPRVLGLGLGLLGVALNVSWTRAQSQADAKPPAFEVASVRPNRSGEGRVAGGFQPGGRYHVTNYSLRALIAAAYLRPQVNPDFLIAGGR